MTDALRTFDGAISIVTGYGLRSTTVWVLVRFDQARPTAAALRPRRTPSATPFMKPGRKGLHALTESHFVTRNCSLELPQK